MNVLNTYHPINIQNLKIIRCLKFDKISQIRKLQFLFEKCVNNYSTLSSEDMVIENRSSTSFPSDRQESCDTFGNLRISLENSKKKNENRRIIRIKSRPIFKKNEANIFGNLSDIKPMWYPDILEDPKVDNDQSDDSSMVRNISRKYRDPQIYLERMKTFVKEKNLKAALDLFVKMKRNYVNPIHPHFTFMIGACGRAGYTEMAFKLLRQMTDRKMTPTPSTLTGLFNSCGECPFHEYGLRKARFLKEKIITKNWELTQITYHAMIKAFGKCGDIQTAFQIVDEMAQADIKIDVETYSFLLMSCISDKESGFTHAIEVWRKMKERKCMPNEFTCNLLIRAARDCDIGPEEISCLLLQHWSNYLKRPYGFKIKDIKKTEPILQLNSGENVKPSGDSMPHIDEVKERLCFEKSQKENQEIFSSLIYTEKVEKDLLIPTAVPSILGSRPESRSDILDIGSIKTPNDRLALLGGFECFLKEMEKEKVKPTIKTFTLLLDCLPPYFEAEEKLISLFEAYNVVPDIGFCNILMKRRIYRNENWAAKNVLLRINQWGLSPDLITFGILAMGCRYYNQALVFLDDLKRLGICPNIAISSALLSRACSVFDFQYLQHILDLMEEENIQPDEKVLTKINKALNIAKKNIINMEHGKEVNKVFKEKDFSKSHKKFCEFYEMWLKRMKFEKEGDVWSQYKTEIVEKYVDEDC